ncbi:MAG: protein kinase [Phycisphaerales bacterium]|nr:MAG: protein kinase [Phycisphaerales bacterium]
MLSPAEQLKGEILDGGWTVVDRVERPEGATGGHFSHGYIVRSRDGVRAYLKAIDLRRAFGQPDVTIALQRITEVFNFERDLCRRCVARKLTRVVRPITDGTHMVVPNDPFSNVSYLIFELASGDVRSQMDTLAALDIAWALRALHHVATGLKQLHGVGIAHQDLKPSNVLVFPELGAKVADLGRSSLKGTVGPFDNLDIVGDRSYAPPDLLYGYLDPDWTQRRIACDAYLLGSMVVFFFLRVSMTALLVSELHQDHRPPRQDDDASPHWGGSFEEVLPYLRDAFSRALQRFATEVPTALRSELRPAVEQLCDPDPRLRRPDLERRVSLFNRIAMRAEMGLLGR